MRGGICSIQLQALTPEAATVVKQAVNLATRRGHAQVTPLHVASAMLATSTGLLRKACLQCHSHPLQCKALELCFNVALNRLPASTSSPLLAPQYSTPSLSNALVAAFKRAQAHQRRGSIENQQQHILALKIEVEQLIISILDDPSVSRVMREAGFSSTLVKTRVEQAVSMEVCSQKAPDRSQAKESTKPQVLGGGNVSPSGPFGQVGGPCIKPLDHVNNDDVTSVLSELVRRRRNTVIVGESVANAEGVARGVMERFEVGNVPGDLRYVQFVSLPLICFRNISKEEVEQKLMEVRNLVKTYVGRGVILYLGDLKWLFEFWTNYCEQKTNYYCSVEHMVMELKKLVCGSGETSRLWLLGIATFKTYMKCKICHPSLETIWELHPFTIPVGSLSLSLNLDSDFQAQERSKVFFKDVTLEDRAGSVRNHLTCCRDCSINFEKEAQSITNSISKKVCTAGSLPTWLQNCKEERSDIMEDQENARLKDLCMKWNSLCNSTHRHPSIIEKPVLFVSSSPSSPTSVSSHERKSNFHHSHLNWPVISESEKAPKECELYTETGDDGYESNFIMFMPDRDVPKPDLLSNPNSSPNSASSSEAVDGLESSQMFKEPKAENHKILCDALEKKVPQHKEVIPEIASTVLRCRSGMRKRENFLKKREDNQDTWMFFLGVNSQAKESISRELAKVVFGSYSNFVTIGMSNFSSPEDCSTDEKSKRKRPRDELKSTYVQRFGEAVNENPHRVFFLEDVDQVDYFSQKGVKQAIQSGSITLPGGESVPLKDAIVIFSCESFSSPMSRSPVRKSPSAENKGKETMDDESSSLSLDLNIAIEDESGGVALGGDTGILELVDKQINFNIQEL
ncbi:Chaperone protein ClpB1 [Spatholobus suberectus]|nr:Chaperone protein ClpB1 [Spatholobus suberectus]